MRELSLNILDVAQNSVRADATSVTITVIADANADLLTIRIADDGKGMSAEFAARVTDPFSTTRTTRKVGMGLPLLKMDAELCGGTFSLDTALGKGTTVETTYRLTHIDRPPMGDLAAAFSMLVAGAPGIRWRLDYRFGAASFSADTDEMKAILGSDVPLESPEVVLFIKDYVEQNISESNGGLSI